MSAINIIVATAALGSFLIGGGGLLSFRSRWRDQDRAQAVRDANIDKATRAVLGDNHEPGMVQTIERHSDLLDRIVKDLSPNSGSSLRDAIDQTAAAVQGVDQKLGRHIRSEAQARRRIREALEKQQHAVGKALIERQHETDGG